MIIPLKELVNSEENQYVRTCAAIKRAAQITKIGDSDLENNKFKVVSTALNQILKQKVDYQLED